MEAMQASEQRGLSGVLENIESLCTRNYHPWRAASHDSGYLVAFSRPSGELSLLRVCCMKAGTERILCDVQFWLYIQNQFDSFLVRLEHVDFDPEALRSRMGGRDTRKVLMLENMPQELLALHCFRHACSVKSFKHVS